MKLTLAAVAFVAAMGAEIPASYAFGDAPWCAVIDVGTGEVYWDCQYRTVEECVPNVIAGNRGFCNVNPYGPGPSIPVMHARYHPRHHKAAALR
ncbi:MAG TPA: DUF3551 domain-containing protein [Xanthobacteraceae bacterium]|nr:DUF3551 domain-containing protein [Xanthobacteraceae bacterium]